MRQTPLYEEHTRIGGKMVDFSGWTLPVHFAGILLEHHHTRTKASLFDCSHMGEFVIRGARGIEAYNALITTNVSKLKIGRARYGFMLNDDGGIIDDLITMRSSEDELFVVSNAGTLERVSTLLTGCVPGLNDVSAETAKIDVQGPLAREVLAGIGVPLVAELRYFGLGKTEWKDWPVLVSRTGYTGELGYELYLPNDAAAPLWRALLERSDVAPAGLGARDTLRLEMGYLLSGQDLDETRTPLEAGQEMFVDWDADFAGRAALEKQRGRGGYFMLTAVRTGSRQAPRHGFEVYHGDDVVGTVTSGTYGPSLEHGVGLAYLDPDMRHPGQVLTAGPRRIGIEITELPFYRGGTCRN